MIKPKFKTVFLILLFIAFVTGATLSFDLAKLIFLKENPIVNSFIYSYILKGIIIMLTTSLVFAINENGLDKRDTMKLKIIYIFILFADISLVVFNTPYIGIIFFSIVQVFLIIRNSTGILNKIKNNTSILKSNNLYLNIALIYILFILIMSSLMKRLITDKVLLYIFLYYIIILFLSVLIAVLNYQLNIFPKINSILIIIGLVAFLLCDINVGYTMVIKTKTISLLTDSLIWIFYTPALTLIALSGYEFS